MSYLGSPTNSIGVHPYNLDEATVSRTFVFILFFDGIYISKQSSPR